MGKNTGERLHNVIKVCLEDAEGVGRMPRRGSKTEWEPWSFLEELMNGKI